MTAGVGEPLSPPPANAIVPGAMAGHGVGRLRSPQERWWC